MVYARGLRAEGRYFSGPRTLRRINWAPSTCIRLPECCAGVLRDIPEERNICAQRSAFVLRPLDYKHTWGKSDLPYRSLAPGFRRASEPRDLRHLSQSVSVDGLMLSFFEHTFIKFVYRAVKPRRLSRRIPFWLPLHPVLRFNVVGCGNRLVWNDLAAHEN